MEISLKKPQIVMRTLEESLQEQRTKFAHFVCITFAQYVSQ